MHIIIRMCVSVIFMGVFSVHALFFNLSDTIDHYRSLLGSIGFFEYNPCRE